MKFIKRIAKAIAGTIVAVLSLPLVQNVILDSPLSWGIEHVIAGTVVGVTVYAIPNKET